MANLPTRQKILLIVLVISLGYLMLPYISEDDVAPVSAPTQASTPVNRPQQARIQQSPTPRPIAPPQQVQSGFSGNDEIGESATLLLDLEVKKGPFYREPKIVKDVVESQPDDRLANFTFNGAAEGTTAIINNNLYGLGEEIDGLEISEIYLDRVVFVDSDGIKYILR